MEGVASGIRQDSKEPECQHIAPKWALQRSIASQSFDAKTGIVGTKLAYAKQHQYGGITAKGWHVPARPFLGVGDRDREELEELAAQWIRERANV